MLNHLIVRLLEILLGAPEGVSIPTVLKMLDISRRVLYYNLEKLNELLHGERFDEVRLDDGVLYLDSGRRAEIERAILEPCRHAYILSSDERKLLSCLCIGISRNSVTLDTLTDLLEVSRNTVLAEVAEIRRELVQSGLSLESRPRIGYELQGDEAQVRKYIMNCFSTLRRSYIGDSAEDILFDALGGISDRARCRGVFDAIRDLVWSSERFSTSFFNKRAIDDIAHYLLIAAIRGTRRGTNIVADELQGIPEARAASYVITGMQELGIPISEVETGYVTAMLMGFKVSTLSSRSLKKSDGFADFEADLTAAFERIALVRFEEHQDLGRNFLLHIWPMYYRVKYGIWVDNLQSAEIKSRYRSFFILASHAVKEVEEKYGLTIPDDEIAYLCVYFGSFLWEDLRTAGPERPDKRSILIVCGVGICTSILIRQQLMALLGGTCRYETIDERVLTPQRAADFDLVMTTVDLPFSAENVMEVSPVLSELQSEKILKWSLAGRMEGARSVRLDELVRIVERNAEVRDRDRLIHSLLLYFDEGDREETELHLQDVFLPGFIQYSCESDVPPEEAVAYSCRPLVAAGLIGERYADDILETIDDLGLYAEYHEGFLLAHAKAGPETRAVGIALGVFENPVVFPKWGRGIRVFVVLATVDNRQHLHALQELLQGLAKQEVRESILGYRGGDPAELYRFLLASGNK